MCFHPGGGREEVETEETQLCVLAHMEESVRLYQMRGEAAQ